MNKPKRIDLTGHQSFIDAVFAKNRAEFGHDQFHMVLDDGTKDADATDKDADGDADKDADGDADKDADADADADDGDDSKWNDPTKAKAEAQRLRDEAAKHRNAKKDAEKKATESDSKLAAVLKVLGIGEGDDQPTADDLAKGLTEAQTEARNTRIENQVIRYASSAGVNADALLDRNSFTKKFTDFDPKADDFAEQVKTAVNDAVKQDESLKVRVAGEGGAPVEGGSGDSANETGPAAELRRIQNRNK